MAFLSFDEYISGFRFVTTRKSRPTGFKEIIKYYDRYIQSSENLSYETNFIKKYDLYHLQRGILNYD